MCIQTIQLAQPTLIWITVTITVKIITINRGSLKLDIFILQQMATLAAIAVAKKYSHHTQKHWPPTNRNFVLFYDKLYIDISIIFVVCNN